MAKRTVSRDDFRGFFALYALAAQHDNKLEGAFRLLKLFTSSRSISDNLLDLWSERVEALDPEAVGNVLCPRARAVGDGTANYDHASDFLHALLIELDRKQH